MAGHGVISGAFDTPVGKVEGCSSLSIQVDAALGALAHAELDASDIDGVLCAYSISEPHPMLSSVVCEYMGLQPNFSAAIQAGGATACVMVQQAASLVETGVCRHVLVITGDNRLSGMTRDKAVAALAAFGHAQFEQPYGINIPAAYALVARRYLHETGATLEQLAAIAVSARKHATLTGKAHMQAPITLEDVANSRTIASPLRLLDCCLISDGGAAVVVSAPETASDRPGPTVAILGTGQKNTHEHLMAAPSLTDFGCKQSSAQAMGRAGVGVGDFDVVEIYDSFTITLLIELESIGFFQRGEAGPAALAGALELGGSLPCNTHGGLLSYAHSGAAGGMFHVVEAVRQLRHEAKGRQVPEAQLAFVHGDGGVLSAHCSLVLGRS